MVPQEKTLFGAGGQSETSRSPHPDLCLEMAAGYMAARCDTGLGLLFYVMWLWSSKSFTASQSKQTELVYYFKRCR